MPLPLHYAGTIYVHSKMMLVDDEYIIVGSANINERSMSATRDTELCIGAYHNSKDRDKRREKLATFRKNLFIEHFGSSSMEEICDSKGIKYCDMPPNNDSFCRQIQKISQMNYETFLALVKGEDCKIISWRAMHVRY
jgi:hypothetical protein